MLAVVESADRAAGDLDVGLVHQCGRIERAWRTGSVQGRPRNALEFDVSQLIELALRRCVAGTGGIEQMGNLGTRHAGSRQTGAAQSLARAHVLRHAGGADRCQVAGRASHPETAPAGPALPVERHVRIIDDPAFLAAGESANGQRSPDGQDR